MRNITLSCSLLMALSCSQNEYFVAENGSDSGSSIFDGELHTNWMSDINEGRYQLERLKRPEGLSNLMVKKQILLSLAYFKNARLNMKDFNDAQLVSLELPSVVFLNGVASLQPNQKLEISFSEVKIELEDLMRDLAKFYDSVSRGAAIEKNISCPSRTFEWTDTNQGRLKVWGSREDLVRVDELAQSNPFASSYSTSNIPQHLLDYFTARPTDVEEYWRLHDILFSFYTRLESGIHVFVLADLPILEEEFSSRGVRPHQVHRPHYIPTRSNERDLVYISGLFSKVRRLKALEKLQDPSEDLLIAQVLDRFRLKVTGFNILDGERVSKTICFITSYEQRLENEFHECLQRAQGFADITLPVDIFLLNGIRRTPIDPVYFNYSQTSYPQGFCTTEGEYLGR